MKTETMKLTEAMQEVYEVAQGKNNGDKVSTRRAGKFTVVTSIKYFVKVVRVSEKGGAEFYAIDTENNEQTKVTMTTAERLAVAGL